MQGRFELLIDREYVARVDDSELGGSDNGASGFIVIFQVDVLQVFAYSLLGQEIVFERSNGTVDQLG